VTSSPTRSRVRAPELRGAGGWINTGGTDLTLAGLRGRIVLLDFWTFCCVNCLHVLDELRELEDRFGDVLVVLGIHSPKFAHEQDHAAVVAAVERYGVAHPVLDDPDLWTWRQYAVKAWPTLAVIDPEGYLVATMAGEGHGPGIAALLEELVAEHTARGTLRRGDAPYVPPPPAATRLRFPAKVLALPDGGLLVSDAGHHQLVELDGDGVTERRRFGDGRRGWRDGTPGVARFAEPQGLALPPPAAAADAEADVVIADTANHLLRGLRLATGAVVTLAGTGRQRRTLTVPAGPALQTDLSSPWDVAWWDGRLVIAMAGTHTLEQYDLANRVVAPLAGTGVESLRDGPASAAWLAQPSGLAPDPGRGWLWFADAETSALRWLAPDGTVHTAVGQGLFDFGHRDGPAGEALLQHPLGVAVLPDGTVAVLDTYNDAVRRYDPATNRVSTLATGVREPSGAALVGGAVWVVESAGHALTRPLGPGQERDVTGPARRTERPPSALAPGRVALDVVFTPAPGQRLDPANGPATRLVVSATPPGLLRSGAGAGTDLTRDLVLAEDVEAGVLHVTATAATCDADAPFPACTVTTQDWGVPVEVRRGGAARLPLVLRGLDAGQPSR